MCSLIEESSNYLETSPKSQFIDRNKCGDVYVSLDVKLLTLHCLFCEFDTEKLDIFLNHLQSEHLSLLAEDNFDLEDNDVIDLIEDETLSESDIKLDSANTIIESFREESPLSENRQETELEVKSDNEINSDDYDEVYDYNIPDDFDELVGNDEEIVDYDDAFDDHNDNSTGLDDITDNKDEDDDPCREIGDDTVSSFEESEHDSNNLQADRVRFCHVLKLVDYIKEYPSLWNCRIKSHKSINQRKRDYEIIAQKMQKEFPNVTINAKYVLEKCSRLKNLYYNYTTLKKISKNDHKIYNKLHFLKDHGPGQISNKTKCTICFKEVRKLVLHMESCHPETCVKQTCPLCAKELPSERLYKSHLRFVHSHVECEHCTEVFKTVKDLNNHIRKQHIDKPQPRVNPSKKQPTDRTCEFCGRQFARSHSLQDHRKTVHLQLYRYECKECPRAFKRKRGLKAHMNSTHLNLRNQVCEFCTKAFFDRKTLKQHLRLHSDIMKYVCKICGNGYKQPSALYSHMKRHQVAKFDNEIIFDLDENKT